MSGRRTIAGGLRRVLAGRAAALLYRAGVLPRAGRWLRSVELGRGPGGFPAVRRRPRGAVVRILTFHRVLPAPDGFLPGLDLAVFARQMDYVARCCRVVGLDEALDAMRTGDVPDDAVVLTFDDGYADNLRWALPVLTERRLPATLFLATGAIGSGRPLWHDRVFRAFHLTRVPRLGEPAPDGRELPLASGPDRAAARTIVLRRLKKLDAAAREREMALLFRRLEVDDVTECPGLMLDWDGVRAMRGHGMTFGAHTVTHPVLSRLGAGDARREIADSKAAIERELGERVRAFAYPNGGRADFTDETKRIVEDCGFDCAVTTIHGINPATADPFELRRMGLVDASTAVFAAKLELQRLEPIEPRPEPARRLEHRRAHP